MFTSSNSKLQQFADDCCWYVCNDMPAEAIDEFETLCKSVLGDIEHGMAYGTPALYDEDEAAALMHEMSVAIGSMVLSWDQGERFSRVRWLASMVCPQSGMYA